MGIISGLLSMFGWGVADFLGANSARKIGNILTLFWMQIAGLSVAFIYFLYNFSSFNIKELYQFILVLVVIAFLQTFSYLAFYKGLKEGQVSLVSPIGASWGLVTVILSIIFYRESLIFNQIIAVALIVFGIILSSINLKELKWQKISTFPGTKEGLIAMFGWGISMFLIVPASKNLGWFLPVFLFKIFSLIFLLFYVLFKKQTLKFKPSLIILIIPIGILDVGAFLSYNFGIRNNYASVVASIAAAFPLITIVLAKVFLKERIVLNQFIGISSILAGLILISF